MIHHSSFLTVSSLIIDLLKENDRSPLEKGGRNRQEGEGGGHQTIAEIDRTNTQGRMGKYL